MHAAERNVIDVHSHLMPGVDDGAPDLAASARALAALTAAGVRTATATPHVDGSLTREPRELDARLAHLDAAWHELEALADTDFPHIDVRRGAEVMLDTPDPDLADPRLRLAGTGFALVEFPHGVVPPQSTRALARLAGAGWTPVVAHPERYLGIEQEPDLIPAWRDAGAVLQVNGASLLGWYGARPRRLAFHFLARGWVDLLASDYHARGEPAIPAYCRQLERIGGTEQLGLLTRTNPARLLRNEWPLPVPALERRKKSFWMAMAGWWR